MSGKCETKGLFLPDSTRTCPFSLSNLCKSDTDNNGFLFVLFVSPHNSDSSFKKPSSLLDKYIQFSQLDIIVSQSSPYRKKSCFLLCKKRLNRIFLLLAAVIIAGKSDIAGNEENSSKI